MQALAARAARVGTSGWLAVCFWMVDECSAVGGWCLGCLGDCATTDALGWGGACEPCVAANTAAPVMMAIPYTYTCSYAPSQGIAHSCAHSDGGVYVCAYLINGPCNVEPSAGDPMQPCCWHARSVRVPACPLTPQAAQTGYTRSANGVMCALAHQWSAAATAVVAVARTLWAGGQHANRKYISTCCAQCSCTSPTARPMHIAHVGCGKNTVGANANCGPTPATGMDP